MEYWNGDVLTEYIYATFTVAGPDVDTGTMEYREGDDLFARYAYESSEATNCEEWLIAYPATSTGVTPEDDTDGDGWPNKAEYQFYDMTGDEADPGNPDSGGQAKGLHEGWNLIGVSSNVCYYITELTADEKARIPVSNYVGITNSDGDGNVDIDDLLYEMGIAGYIDEITAWCPTGTQNEAWKYESSETWPTNTLKYISGGFGYWVKANASCTWKLDTYHRLKSIGDTEEMPMYHKGNLIGNLFTKVHYKNIPADLMPEFGSDEVAQVEAAESYLHDYIMGLITKNGGTPLAAGDVEEMVAVDRKGAHSYFYGYPDSFQTLKYVGPGMGLWIKMKEGLSGVEFNFPSE
ncbi:MAG: hypothetical protein P9M00_04925 [Candidatus Tritonobacter lacicola]|nr:hypothetical protein [Candidatus Tritonobacter lacicola]